MISTEIESTGFYLNFYELCDSTHTSAMYMLELVNHEIAIPVKGQVQQEWLFNITATALVKRAMRLHSDLEIDWADIKLILNLLDEISDLQIQNKNLKQQLNRFLEK